jgi:uncharacterized protein YjiS (DUF1127 family)
MNIRFRYASAATSLSHGLEETAMNLNIRNFIAGLIREYELRQAMRAIERLDDHALRDIGLDRGGVEGSVRQGRF